MAVEAASMNTEYTNQMTALLHKLAGADGFVSPQETAWIELIRAEMPEPEGDQSAHFDPEKLKSLVKSASDAEDLVRLLFLVSLADGQTTPDELDVIREIAKLFEMEEADLEKIRKETILVEEPR